MNPICEKCYSRNTHPMTGSSTFFSTVIEPNLILAKRASKHWRIHLSLLPSQSCHRCDDWCGARWCDQPSARASAV